MIYSTDKDTNNFVKGMFASGDAVGYERGRKHGKLKLRNGATMFMPVSPSDRRGLLNMKATARRLLASPG